LLLIENGRIIRKHLDQELIKEEDLLSQLREQGIAEIGSVRKCFLEINGHFSVLTEVKGARKPKVNDDDLKAVHKST
jgi:uncharacterized membrane protein YcaP (DUF421 family)